MVACCRCNWTGSCKGCACVKAGKPCSSCLPSKMGTCLNVSSTPTPTPSTPDTTRTTSNHSTPEHDSASASPLPPKGSLCAPSAIASPSDDCEEAGAAGYLAEDSESESHPSNNTLALESSPPLQQNTRQLPADHPSSHSQPSETHASATDSQYQPSATVPPPNHYPQLPEYAPMSAPMFTWGRLDGPAFKAALDAVYSEVVHWRRNCFMTPFGKAGKAFTKELARLYLAFGSASTLESIALKAATVLPILLLQKPSRASKTKHHIECLERRMQLWSNGDLDELMREGRAIQKRLPKQGPNKDNSNLSRSFSNLMFLGKCKAALDLLPREKNGGILHIDDPANPDDPNSPTVRESLTSKHPVGQPAFPSCTVPEEPLDPHPVIFESIDGNVIRAAALKVNGAAGPSGLDSREWRRLCTSHKGASWDLCESLASVARRLCTSYVDPSSTAPLLASRLIALDKNPGVRPIGIGDTARRIIAKAVLSIVGPDIQYASGCQQLCGGQIAGIEAAVHAARKAFNSEECEAALLVDATNAFNSLNRQVALQNIRRLCPPIATILVNSYRDPTDLFVDNDVILSQEGTTQGDPLAMAMYGLATIPLIRRLNGLCKQVWYADDSTAFGSLEQLRGWWDRLTAEGPSYGYFANPVKTWLVTKDKHLENAKTIFTNSGVNITPNGRPYLGAALGTPDFIEDHLSSKVRAWSLSVTTLSEIAKTQPHAAYSALVHGLLSKWSYLCRVTPNISHQLTPLDDALRTELLPALTSRPPPNDQEFALFALPARHGGLGVRLPSKNAEREFQSSELITSSLTNNILDQNQEYGYDTIANQLQMKADVSKNNREQNTKEADEIFSHLTVLQQKTVVQAKEKGASTWLTVLPLRDHGFTLRKAAFHDALALRYGWTPSNLPSKCDCDNTFTVEHALSCRKGGFPTLRHNEIRDLTVNLLTEACSEVCIEPNLQPVTPEQLSGATANTQDGARLDVSANGVWGGRHEKTYFDVRVFNPHAPSNRSQSLPTCYRKHEREKKRAYEQRIREVEHSTFTPLVFSAAGGMGREATCFYKRLASMLAQKWDSPYSSTLCWLRCRISFSLIRSAIQALRGARSSQGHAARLPVALELTIAEAQIR